MSQTEIKVTSRKPAGAYAKAVRVSFSGSEESDAVDVVTISALGNAIDRAVAAAAQVERDGIGSIARVQTEFVDVGATRSPRIEIRMHKLAAAAVGSPGCAPERPPRFTGDFEETPEGNFIWHASLVLLLYLQHPDRARSLRGARILELGSGLGHLGHGLARLGAHITCTEQAKCLPVLKASLAKLDEAHGPADGNGGSIRAVELSWGEEGWAASALAAEGTGAFDVVISAEVVFMEETHDLLLWTWQRLCGPQTSVYSVFINRPFSWNFFAKLHDLDMFEVEQMEDDRDFDPCGLEEIHMHLVTLKAKQ